MLALFVAACAGDSAPPPGDRSPRAGHPLPFRAEGDYLAYWTTADAYQPFFMKGVNLGVGVPGAAPGQLAITRDQYRRWLARMGELGLNTIRIYTLHFPRFYEELAAYNLRNPDNELFLLQGIWLDEENPTGDFFDMSETYDEEIASVIDAAHGNAEVPFRFGKAFGTYSTDVTPWIVGWVVGREIQPDEADNTNLRHAEVTSYEGRSLSLHEAQPMEAWLAERLDEVVTYERAGYGTTRPISYSSWPTLDPLKHPIEGSPDEDRIDLDLGDLDLFGAPGGFFIIYHAYPYYPDFMVETPEYQDATDAFGRNSYVGYLEALVAHYAGTPVVIGEFGTPGSWGNAHYAMNGMHHGGHDEAMTGHYAARMLSNIWETGCAGGVYFAWMDEWWKRTWITDELDFPRDRRRLWHNVTAAEQNFGLIAFDLGPPRLDQYAPVETEGPVRSLLVGVDAEFFRVRLELSSALSPGEELVIGFDTYRDDLGESLLPDGVVSVNRSEIALVLTGDGTADLFVTEAYDTYGLWHGTSQDHQLYHSVPSDEGAWVPVRWKNNGPHSSRDGVWRFPETVDEIGVLGVRRAGEPVSNLDSVVLDGDRVDIRVPWTLLQVSDPSRRAVLDDDRMTPGRETALTAGIALSVSFRGQLVETARYGWETWNEAPPTVEREKPSLELFGQGVRALPGDL